MLKGDHQVYDPSVAFPYEPHYALIAHIQNGKWPNMLPLMSAETAGFVKRCFRTAAARSFSVHELLEDPWISDRKPVLQLILREERMTCTPHVTPNARPYLAGRDGLQALAVLNSVDFFAEPCAKLLAARLRTPREDGGHTSAVGQPRSHQQKDFSDQGLHRRRALCHRGNWWQLGMSSSLAPCSCPWIRDSLAGRADAWLRLADLCFEAYLKRAVRPHRAEAKELGRKRKEIHEAKLEAERSKQREEQERQRSASVCC